MPLAGRAIRFIALLLWGIALPPQLAAAESLRHGQGLLWQVEKDGAPASHVFGTIHLADPEIVALPRPVRDAFAASRSLSVEIILNATAQIQLATAMALPQGRLLQDILPAGLFADALSAGERYGIGATQANRLKPWALALLLSMPPAGDASARERVALDIWLQRAAASRDMPVHALESVAEQIAVFEGLSDADQIAYLRMTAKGQAEIARVVPALKAEYLSGNLDAIHALTHQGLDPESRRFQRLLETRLFAERNARMVSRMIARLDEGNAFVAVGALHLPGEDGVLHLLEKRGYRVTRKH